MKNVNVQAIRDFVASIERDPTVARKNKAERLVKITEQRCPGTECVTRQIPLEIVLET